MSTYYYLYINLDFKKYCENIVTILKCIQNIAENVYILFSPFCDIMQRYKVYHKKKNLHLNNELLNTLLNLAFFFSLHQV